MKLDFIYRPKRRDIQSPVKDASAGTVAPAKSVTPRKPRQKPIPVVQGMEGPTSANSAPAGTLAADMEIASGGLSESTVAKIAVEATRKAKERISAEKPQSRTQDLKALQTRLKSLLSKSEFKQMNKLFARLERNRESNKKAQAAWRDRQKAK